MAKKSNDMVVDAYAINYSRIASPVAKYETDGKNPEELEWKADLLIDEETVDKIKEQYPNLRKKMNPITSKNYKKVYKVDMPKGIEGPHILKLTMDFAVKFNDPKKGETLFYKPQPKVLLSQGKKKAKEITFDEYIGNGSVGRVIIKHRTTQYNKKPIDVLELGSILLTELVEVEQKPGQGGNQEDDVESAFGLEEVEESETEAPERNEKGLKGDSTDDFDDEQDDDDDDDDDEDEDM
jgi:hypothetical protein